MAWLKQCIITPKCVYSLNLHSFLQSSHIWRWEGKVPFCLSDRIKGEIRICNDRGTYRKGGCSLGRPLPFQTWWIKGWPLISPLDRPPSPFCLCQSLRSSTTLPCLEDRLRESFTQPSWIFPNCPWTLAMKLSRIGYWHKNLQICYM